MYFLEGTFTMIMMKSVKWLKKGKKKANISDFQRSYTVNKTVILLVITYSKWPANEKVCLETLWDTIDISSFKVKIIWNETK